MAGPWSLDKLSAVAGEPERRLRRYADVGLLHRQPDGDFEPDSLRRLRMIRFARSRGVGDEQLVAATARQGDLLGLFGEHDPVDEEAGSLTDTAQELGLDDALIAELAEILDWGDTERSPRRTSPCCARWPRRWRSGDGDAARRNEEAVV